MTEHFVPTVAGTGPGLLLAHGAGGGVDANYGALIPELANTHTVVGGDYPGSGATPRGDESLTLDGLADELVRLALAEGLVEFAILGYSLGTPVAVRAATRYPGRVTGLVLTAGFACPDNRLRLAADVWAALLRGGDRRLLARFLTLMATGAPRLNALSPDELAREIDALAEAVPDGSPEQVALVESVDVRTELGELAVPTLVVATAVDALVGPWSSRALADGIPGSELIEIQAGHDIQAEAGDEWLAAVRGFLDRLG